MRPPLLLLLLLLLLLPPLLPPPPPLPPQSGPPRRIRCPTPPWPSSRSLFRLKRRPRSSPCCGTRGTTYETRPPHDRPDPLPDRRLCPFAPGGPGVPADRAAALLSLRGQDFARGGGALTGHGGRADHPGARDRKSTRLNSSH